MSRALFWKTLRDARLLLVILVLATVAFELLFVIFVREMLQEMLMQIASVWLEKAPFRRMVNSMLGADLAVELTPTSLMAIGFSHPLMYTFMWVLLLTIGTRGLVGEIDRGTADLLLGLPVSRTAVYGSVSATLVLAAVLISVATVCGAGLGAVFIPLKEPLNLARLWILVANLLALNLAITGLTTLVSSLASRRGTAVATVLTVLLVSFLIQFLAPLWDPARRIECLGLLHYYRPLPAVRTGQWPLADIFTLLAVAMVAWIVGLWYFRRRDIPAA